jgi:hypothetical protein
MQIEFHSIQLVYFSSRQFPLSAFSVLSILFFSSISFLTSAEGKQYQETELYEDYMGGSGPSGYDNDRLSDCFVACVQQMWPSILAFRRYFSSLMQCQTETSLSVFQKYTCVTSVILW